MMIYTHLTTMGENQSPARNCFTIVREHFFPWLATFSGRLYKKLCQRSGLCLWSWLGLRSYLGGPRLGYHECHEPRLPSNFLCAGAPNQTKARHESKKSTHAWPNRCIFRKCAHRTSFLRANSFAFCITLKLVLNYRPHRFRTSTC